MPPRRRTSYGSNPTPPAAATPRSSGSGAHPGNGGQHQPRGGARVQSPTTTGAHHTTTGARAGHQQHGAAGTQRPSREEKPGSNPTMMDRMSNLLNGNSAAAGRTASTARAAAPASAAAPGQQVPEVDDSSFQHKSDKEYELGVDIKRRIAQFFATSEDPTHVKNAEAQSTAAKLATEYWKWAAKSRKVKSITEAIVHDFKDARFAQLQYFRKEFSEGFYHTFLAHNKHGSGRNGHSHHHRNIRHVFETDPDKLYSVSELVKKYSEPVTHLVGMFVDELGKQKKSGHNFVGNRVDAFPHEQVPTLKQGLRTSAGLSAEGVQKLLWSELIPQHDADAILHGHRLPIDYAATHKQVFDAANAITEGRLSEQIVHDSHDYQEQIKNHKHKQKEWRQLKREGKADLLMREKFANNYWATFLDFKRRSLSYFADELASKKEGKSNEDPPDVHSRKHDLFHHKDNALKLKLYQALTSRALNIRVEVGYSNKGKWSDIQRDGDQKGPPTLANYWEKRLPPQQFGSAVSSMLREEGYQAEQAGKHLRRFEPILQEILPGPTPEGSPSRLEPSRLTDGAREQLGVTQEDPYWYEYKPLPPQVPEKYPAMPEELAHKVTEQLQKRQREGRRLSGPSPGCQFGGDRDRASTSFFAFDDRAPDQQVTAGGQGQLTALSDENDVDLLEHDLHQVVQASSSLLEENKSSNSTSTTAEIQQKEKISSAGELLDSSATSTTSLGTSLAPANQHVHEGGSPAEQRSTAAENSPPATKNEKNENSRGDDDHRLSRKYESMEQHQVKKVAGTIPTSPGRRQREQITHISTRPRKLRESTKLRIKQEDGIPVKQENELDDAERHDRTVMPQPPAIISPGRHTDYTEGYKDDEKDHALALAQPSENTSPMIDAAAPRDDHLLTSETDLDTSERTAPSTMTSWFNDLEIMAGVDPHAGRLSTSPAIKVASSGEQSGTWTRENSTRSITITPLSSSHQQVGDHHPGGRRPSVVLPASTSSSSAEDQVAQQTLMLGFASKFLAVFSRFLVATGSSSSSDDEQQASSPFGPRVMLPAGMLYSDAIACLLLIIIFFCGLVAAVKGCSSSCSTSSRSRTSLFASNSRSCREPHGTREEEEEETQLIARQKNFFCNSCKVLDYKHSSGSALMKNHDDESSFSTTCTTTILVFSLCNKTAVAVGILVFVGFSYFAATMPEVLFGNDRQLYGQQRKFLGEQLVYALQLIVIWVWKSVVSIACPLVALVLVPEKNLLCIACGGPGGSAEFFVMQDNAGCNLVCGWTHDFT
ncbi:unnamed protein product [Amoebophrya sp. A120]|nr:unnamed protein product [Amoebophrya sp. A120]|eukprot:GSA120T00009991001.1